MKQEKQKHVWKRSLYRPQRICTTLVSGLVFPPPFRTLTEGRLAFCPLDFQSFPSSHLQTFPSKSQQFIQGQATKKVTEQTISARWLRTFGDMGKGGVVEEEENLKAGDRENSDAGESLHTHNAGISPQH